MADSSKARFSLQKAVQVRLDNLGLVKIHSCFINNPQYMEGLEDWLELQRSMGRSDEIRKMAALKKELAEKDKLSPLLSEAIAMYLAKETSKRGFTKESIKSILLTVFRIAPPSSGPLSSKPQRLKLLVQCNTSNPCKLDRAVADKANEIKSKNAGDVSTWLYQQECNKTKVNMMTDQTLSTISVMVLQALCKIEVDIPESIDVSNEIDREFEYANYFFDAFKGNMYKKRDVHFIYELAANMTLMVLDENSNKEMLTVQESKRLLICH
jgi:hypothetical protein